MFSSKAKTNSTTPEAISASWVFSSSSMAPMAMLEVSVRTLWNRLFGISGLPPTTMMTAMVSPKALPTARITPEVTPLLAAGKTILKVASASVEPSASAPS